MDKTLIAKMTICFGIYYGSWAALRSWFLEDAEILQAMGWNIVVTHILFLTWFTLVTAPLWNRRALRLRPTNRLNKC